MSLLGEYLRYACLYLSYMKLTVFSFQNLQVSLPILAQCSISIPLKKSENQRFSDVFRWYSNETLAKMDK